MFQLVENRDSSSQLLASDCDFVTFLVHSECPLLGHQEQSAWTLVGQAAGVSSHMYVPLFCTCLRERFFVFLSQG